MQVGACRSACAAGVCISPGFLDSCPAQISFSLPPRLQTTGKGRFSFSFEGWGIYFDLYIVLKYLPASRRCYRIRETVV